MPLLPVLARLDGKNFSKFTKGLKRPYDQRMSQLMQDVTLDLMRQSSAVAAYTQSDEITLVFDSNDYLRPIYLDGRIQKLVSILAARATALFNRGLPETLPEKAHLLPLFDCRVWALPNRVEASNAVLWRVKDAIRNSVSMAAQAEFSHKSLQGKRRDEMKAMLVEREQPWDNHPTFFKWGTLWVRRRINRPFSAEEIEVLPEKHEARRNPELQIQRSVCAQVECCFSEVSNRVEVLFEGAEPEFKLK